TRFSRDWSSDVCSSDLGGLFFYLGIALTGEASLRGTIGNLAVVLLFCLPMVTMRQIAEETRTGTLELLLTSPVPLGALILGKWRSEERRVGNGGGAQGA